MLTAHEARGATWLLDRLVARLRAGGLYLQAEVVRRTGRELLGQPDGPDPEAADIGVLPADDPDGVETTECIEVVKVNVTEAGR